MLARRSSRRCCCTTRSRPSTPATQPRSTSSGSTTLDYPTATRGYQEEYFRLLFQDSLTAVGEAQGRQRLPYIGGTVIDGIHRLTHLSLVLLGGYEVAIGQVKPDNPPADAESTPEDQATDETPEVESEPETPGSPPDQKPRRRVFKRIGPQPMTAEEREEAERLRIVAAKYGTDHTAIVGRFQMNGQYIDMNHDADTTV